ncbi:Ditrans,polycis-polyprenyl diphosphate synthase ((2E,6E)-farnesyldiphosphate specific) [Aphelenchoides besseyi]|nr:Ditrans,polycis-polyprenyl diphosphate synthase ((2E,6E)-farnesyldiphosphate specific) [Aphelenchoides besseyi]KAI6211392.1 Ditrans,polycis-polyprenyl diphosphate synthase ((2E,6E)-farnesyldiphosphate specific) [Aphelenchoides besseyi]
MFSTLFIGLLSIFVFLIDLFSFLSSKLSLTYLKRLIASLLSKEKVVDPLKIPHHMAVAFGTDDLINLNLLCDFIYFAAQDGIRRLSFYDPNGRISEMLHDLEHTWYRLAKRKQLRRPVNFDITKPSAIASPRTSSTSLEVCVLSRRHGKEALLNICAELSQTSIEITVDEIRRQLEIQGIYEVDFLLTIGCANTLHDFPPWSLRVAEICSMERLNSTDRLRADEFRLILADFTKRERRLGY